MGINYLIASWSGSRFFRNRHNHCLSKHLEHLNTIKHNLEQITIGYPYNPDEDEGYKEFMSSLYQMNDGTPIVVMPMINEGLSYGQWSRMYDHYRNEFSHYIFIEDDYVPVKDNFDQELIDMFDESECGFLCGLHANEGDELGRGPCPTNHSAISNGISSSKILNEVHGINGLYRKDTPQKLHQIFFSNNFVKKGHVIKDWLHKYRSLYWAHKQSFRMFWDGTHEEDLIVPIQFLHEGKNWKIEKYTRSKEGIKPAACRSSKKVPPQVLKQIMDGRAGKGETELRRALLRQRRVLQRQSTKRR